MEQVTTETLKSGDAKPAVNPIGAKTPTPTEKPAVAAKAAVNEPAVKANFNEKTGEPKGSQEDKAATLRKAKIKTAAYALIDALDEADYEETQLTHRVINETFSQCRKVARAADLKNAGWDPFAPIV